MKHVNINEGDTVAAVINNDLCVCTVKVLHPDFYPPMAIVLNGETGESVKVPISQLAPVDVEKDAAENVQEIPEGAIVMTKESFMDKFGKVVADISTDMIKENPGSGFAFCTSMNIIGALVAHKLFEESDGEDDT